MGLPSAKWMFVIGFTGAYAAGRWKRHELEQAQRHEELMRVLDERERADRERWRRVEAQRWAGFLATGAGRAWLDWADRAHASLAMIGRMDREWEDARARDLPAGRRAMHASRPDILYPDPHAWGLDYAYPRPARMLASACPVLGVLTILLFGWTALSDIGRNGLFSTIGSTVILAVPVMLAMILLAGLLALPVNAPHDNRWMHWATGVAILIILLAYPALDDRLPDVLRADLTPLFALTGVACVASGVTAGMIMLDTDERHRQARFAFEWMRDAWSRLDAAADGRYPDSWYAGGRGKLDEYARRVRDTLDRVAAGDWTDAAAGRLPMLMGRPPLVGVDRMPEWAAAGRAWLASGGRPATPPADRRRRARTR